MKKFRCGFVWDWGFHLCENYYDGPFWDFQFLNFFAVWSLEGLPYIFQDKK